MKKLIITVVCAASLNGARFSKADQVTIGALKDNTLFESGTGSSSNGIGTYCFAGRVAPSGAGALRRALVAFDVAGNIPAGATIDAVTLRLNMSRTISGNESVTLHKLLADWGEGTSNAAGQEGTGAAATPGDATWLHTFFPGSFWSAAGGDFVVGSSASASVGGLGPYTWGSTAALVADVQDWLDYPGNNFGWILIGNESVLTTAKRFDTREMSVAANRPQLVVDYTPASGIPAAGDWGLVIMLLVLLAAGALLIRRRGSVPSA